MTKNPKSGVGFSLIEILVVMGVLTLILTMALFGLRASQKAEDQRAASQKFLTELFAMQTQAFNSAPPTTCNLGDLGPPPCTLTYRNVTLIALSDRYGLDSRTVTLKPGALISLSTGPIGSVKLCFAHPSVQSMAGSDCEPCNSWACTGTLFDTVVTSPLVVTFFSFNPGSPARRVVIWGLGKFVTKMYEEPVP